MRKIVICFFIAAALFITYGSASAAQVNVKRPANLKCHADEMRNALLHMNKGQNITINLELFCQAGAVKYISIGPTGSTAQFVPPNHVIYQICGNPCRK
ncbi:MAG: hypothetical protein AB7E04_07145 [Desulfobacteraceae bacterium]